LKTWALSEEGLSELKSILPGKKEESRGPKKARARGKKKGGGEKGLGLFGHHEGLKRGKIILACGEEENVRSRFKRSGPRTSIRRTELTEKRRKEGGRKRRETISTIMSSEHGGGKHRKGEERQ